MAVGATSDAGGAIGGDSLFKGDPLKKGWGIGGGVLDDAEASIDS